jgi:hypothetical protein
MELNKLKSKKLGMSYGHKQEIMELEEATGLTVTLLSQFKDRGCAITLEDIPSGQISVKEFIHNPLFELFERSFGYQIVTGENEVDAIYLYFDNTYNWSLPINTYHLEKVIDCLNNSDDCMGTRFSFHTEKTLVSIFMEVI